MLTGQSHSLLERPLTGRPFALEKKQTRGGGVEVGRRFARSVTNTNPHRCNRRLFKDQLKGAACTETVSSFLYIPEERSRSPGSPACWRPVHRTKSARRPRSCGARTLPAERPSCFSSRRPEHASDGFRQVGGGKWRHSQQPRKVTPARGGRGAGGAGRKVKRRTWPNPRGRGTRGAGLAGPGAPGGDCRRLEAGTRALAAETRAPRTRTTFSSEGPAARPGRSAERKAHSPAAL